jgi:DNA polymerase-4
VRSVDPHEDRKSVSAENTFNEDLTETAALEDELWPLCEKVAGRMRREGVVGQVITLKLKTTDFRILTRRRTLGVPTQTARTLFACGRELLKAEANGRAFRLIGIGLSDLLEAAPPSDLFGDGEARTRATEQTVDKLRSKFGEAAVVSGRALKR